MKLTDKPVNSQTMKELSIQSLLGLIRTSSSVIVTLLEMEGKDEAFQEAREKALFQVAESIVRDSCEVYGKLQQRFDDVPA